MLLASLTIPHYLELDSIDLAAYRFAPFANDHEPEAEAAWSPDGKSIAYLKMIAGIPQLMVRALDSAMVRAYYQRVFAIDIDFRDVSKRLKQMTKAATK